MNREKRERKKERERTKLGRKGKTKIKRGKK